MTTEALAPAAATPAVMTGRAGEIDLPQVIVDARLQAAARFLEFFAGADRERENAGGAEGGRSGNPWVCEARGSGCATSPRSTWPPTSGPIPGRPPR